MIRCFALAVLAFAGAALLAGCGKGEQLYDVSGTIDYKGPNDEKPVERSFSTNIKPMDNLLDTALVAISRARSR